MPGAGAPVDFMTHQALKGLITMRPFRPFSLLVSSGLVIEIASEDSIMLHPKSKRVAVVFEDDGGFKIVDLESVEVLQAR
jgi:hypothetical protein